MSLYNYLLKMRKCSYVSQSHRFGKYDQKITIKFNSTDDGRMIHELDDEEEINSQ